MRPTKAARSSHYRTTLLPRRFKRAPYGHCQQAWKGGWKAGDGKSKRETKLRGKYKSKAACACAVRRVHPKANGATYSTKHRTCYAEFGMYGRHRASHWHSVYVHEPVWRHGRPNRIAYCEHTRSIAQFWKDTVQQRRKRPSNYLTVSQLEARVCLLLKFTGLPAGLLPAGLLPITYILVVVCPQVLRIRFGQCRSGYRCLEQYMFPYLEAVVHDQAEYRKQQAHHNKQCPSYAPFYRATRTFTSSAARRARPAIADLARLTKKMKCVQRKKESLKWHRAAAAAVKRSDKTMDRHVRKTTFLKSLCAYLRVYGKRQQNHAVQMAKQKNYWLWKGRVAGRRVHVHGVNLRTRWKAMFGPDNVKAYHYWQQERLYRYLGRTHLGRWRRLCKITMPNMSRIKLPHCGKLRHRWLQAGKVRKQWER